MSPFSLFGSHDVIGDSEEDLEDLDEDQIMKILKDQGMMRKEKSELKAMQLFQGVECK